MTKEILINVGARETRIALTEDSRLAELHIEREERVVGSLYKARVENVLPGMDAAFVDIGLSRNAFLYVGDVLPTGETDTATADDDEDDDDDLAEGHDDEDEDGGSSTKTAPKRRGERTRATRRSVLRRQKIGEVLKVGQELLVQVIKGPRGTKGARVSTRVSLPGRYLVLMPEADNIGISRKIEDSKERDRLRKIGDKLIEPGFGIIIRTEAEEKTEQELIADRDFLLKLWRQVVETQKKVRAPSLVHADLTIVYKTVRDLFGSDVSRLVVDDPAEYEQANELLEMVSPRLRGRIQLYTGDVPIFDHFNIEPEIEKSLKRKVWLRSGGYLIFDETEALTVIDVNTGKFVGGSNLSETILKTNLDAAAEIARQLRLRDIGGIIVIDFIDMNSARDKQHVVKTLEAALKRDRSRTKISNISPLGLVEMTRKRTAETISDFLSEPCQVCGGRGKLPSPDTISLALERELWRVTRDGKKDREALLVTCHPDVAESLVGPEGETIDRIERELQRAVFVRAVADAHMEKFDITGGDLADLERKQTQVHRAQIVECRIARSWAQPEPAVVGWADGLLVNLDDGRKYAGQRVKVRIDQAYRSFARGTVLSGAHRSG